jgi:hypothetical protein
MDVGISPPDTDVEDHEPEVVPFGVSPWLFADERRFLDGGSLEEDSDNCLVAAARYGRGTIPSTVTIDFQDTATSALTSKLVHRAFPATTLCAKMKLIKGKHEQQINQLL